MRIFKRYLPLMVAKHVKTYYQGYLYLQDCGQLEFQNGRLIMPSFNAFDLGEKCDDLVHLDFVRQIQNRVKEVNALIKQMNKYAA